MQILIDIPEEEYMEIKRYYDNLPIYSTVEAELYYIAKGTPLPKDHGRLIDADATIIRVRDEEATPIYPYITKILNNAPTILEADKESEDKG